MAFSGPRKKNIGLLPIFLVKYLILNDCHNASFTLAMRPNGQFKCSQSLCSHLQWPKCGLVIIFASSHKCDYRRDLNVSNRLKYNNENNYLQAIIGERFFRHFIPSGIYVPTQSRHEWATIEREKKAAHAFGIFHLASEFPWQMKRITSPGSAPILRDIAHFLLVRSHASNCVIRKCHSIHDSDISVRFVASSHERIRFCDEYTNAISFALSVALGWLECAQNYVTRLTDAIAMELKYSTRAP